MTSQIKRRSVEILEECIELQNLKGSDYQNPNSTVRQADYYVNGISTIYDIMHAKMLRLKSLMEANQVDSSQTQKFESMQDSVKDLINYASFAAAYLEGKVDGQSKDRNIFNRVIKNEAGPTS